MTDAITNRIQMFANRCLRHVLNIKWPEKIFNEYLWERTNQKPASQDIKNRSHPEKAGRQFNETNCGQELTGKPRQTWRKSTTGEEEAAGKI